MFVPSSYREPDSSWMVDLIRANPLALAAANGRPEDGPFATHLPVIFDPDTSGEWTGELPGATLLGHMNRANPHWAALESGSVLLLTFTGPHSYVSPTVYEVTPAAPTWNFTAVHVRGVVEKIDSVQETLGVVESTVRAFEGRFGDGWDMTASLGSVPLHRDRRRGHVQAQPGAARRSPRAGPGVLRAERLHLQA